MTSKACIACGLVKPPEGFYKHPKMADGRLNKCIECVKAYQRERQKQPDVRAYDQARSQQPHRVAARKAYRQTEAGKLAKQRSLKKFRQQHQDKDRARNEVAYALRTGRLQRQPCEVCSQAPAEAHHDDYAKPLDVRWLCVAHHAEHHRKVKEAA